MASHAPASTLLEPRDAGEVADALRRANGEGMTVEPRGAGTKEGWAARTRDPDAVLALRRLDAPIDHCPGDLTATAPAGLSLQALNQALAREGQWLPLDPLAAGGTVGGIVAANDSGPRRHRYGAPRDLIIGVEMALADGRRAKAGGRVVKNVAGYDLSRLMCGSLGSLAVITSVTFKLAPIAPASCTVRAGGMNAQSASALATRIDAEALAPSALELSGPPWQLLVRFETTADAAARHADTARALCAEEGFAADILRGRDEAAVWDGLAVRLGPDQAAAAPQPGADRAPAETALLKIAVLPGALVELLAYFERARHEHGPVLQVTARAALGVIYVRMGGSAALQTQVIPEARHIAVHHGGHLTVLEAARAVRAQVRSWTPAASAVPLIRAVKARFDPKGTLPELAR